MAVPAGPYTVTAGVALNLSPPFSQRQRFSAAVVANMSAFLCAVQLQTGPAIWLKAWSLHAYDLTGAEANLLVTPQISVAPTATSGTLTVDWLELDDPAPPDFTIALYPPATSDFDPYGPFTAYNNTVATGTVNVILPAPPAGRYWRVRRMAIIAGTTTASTVNALYIVGTTSNGAVISQYSQATGIDYQESMDLLINEGLSAHNATGASAACTVWARPEPLPT